MDRLRGGFTNPTAGTEYATSTPATSPPFNTNPRPAPGAAPLKGPATGPEARLNDRNTRRARQQLCDGRPREKASLPPARRRECSLVRRTRASSASLSTSGRRKRCGNVDCGALGGWVCATCNTTHFTADKRCAACHHPASEYARLARKSVGSPAEWWKTHRERLRSTAITDAYVPTSHCLCIRKDCFYSLHRDFDVSKFTAERKM